MVFDGVLVGAVALGVVHGLEPGHGWPVAASYALGRDRQWFWGLAAGLVLGLGHLVSSFVVVGLFLYADASLGLSGLNEPLVVRGVEVGGPFGVVAGLLLVGLGVREYLGRGEGHFHGEGLGGGHVHGGRGSVEGGGLLGMAWFALLLGFVHEEEVQLVAICAGSGFCLGAVSAYALAVLAGLVGLTLAVLGGYQRYEERMEGVERILPLVSAAVLVCMGGALALGLA